MIPSCLLPISTPRVAHAQHLNFHALLRDLAAEYERIRLENDRMRKDFGIDYGEGETVQITDRTKGDAGREQLILDDAVTPKSVEALPNSGRKVDESSTKLAADGPGRIDSCELVDASDSLAAPKTCDSMFEVGKSADDAAHQMPEDTPLTPSRTTAPQLQFLWTQSLQSMKDLQHDSTASMDKHLVRKETRGGDTLRSKGCMQRFIISPNDFKRVLWDLVGVFVLGIDLIMVPLIAFDLPHSIATETVNMSCTFYWTLDVLASFLTGLHVAGAVELRPKEIAKRYLRSWFVADMIIILFDWMLFIASNSNAASVFRASKLLRMSRILRAMRLARLVRLMKMPQILDEVADVFQGDTMLTAFRVIRSIITLAFANHFLACGWYAVGTMSEPSWIDRMDNENRDLAFRYITSLHWSLTQFTPASMEIFPRGFPERVYAICVLFLALVVFSSFVSSITNAMNTLRVKNAESNRQRSNLMRFIRENRLSLDLGNRIRAFAKHLHSRVKLRVHEDDIDAFKVLPDHLKSQLHWEVYVPIVSIHPFFDFCKDPFQTFILKVFRSGLKEQTVPTGQQLYAAGEECKCMYFILSGHLDYLLGKTSLVLRLVQQHEWCAEVSLWLVWLHQGQLSALAPAELIALDGSTFRMLVSNCGSPGIFNLCKSYAEEFQNRASTLKPGDSLDIYCDHGSALEVTHRAFDSCSVDGRSSSKRGKKELARLGADTWKSAPAASASM